MISLPTLLISILALAGSAGAITCEELAELLASDEKVTLIDVRSSKTFQDGHIPGSMNVPAPLCGKKKLPALGKVIVVGGDLDLGSVRKAAQRLEETPGIRTAVLEGGYSRWKALSMTTTSPPGLTANPLEPLVSYDHLVRAAKSNPHVVLIDIRGNPESLARKARRAPRRPVPRPPGPDENDAGTDTTIDADRRFKVYTAKPENGEPVTVVDDGEGRAQQVLAHLGDPKTEVKELDRAAVSRLLASQDDAARQRTIDLRVHGAELARMVNLEERFRGTECVDCSYLWSVPQALRDSTTTEVLRGLDRTHAKVYVIIDDGMGSGQRFSRQLRSAGIRRYYVLMGGEDALRREGVPERRTP